MSGANCRLGNIKYALTDLIFVKEHNANYYFTENFKDLLISICGRSSKIVWKWFKILKGSSDNKRTNNYKCFIETSANNLKGTADR